MISIPLDSYAEGAALATDLVLTSPFHHADRLDRLQSASELASFLASRNVTTSTPTRDDLVAVAKVRRQLGELIDPRNEQDRVAEATHLIAGTRAVASIELLHAASHQWALVLHPSASVAEEIAARAGVAILAVTRNFGPTRFRRCARDGCSGVFIDTSRGGQRAYCTPSICGNRVNTRRYRTRQAAGESS